MRILVTGSAGFIGSALSLKLLERGDEVLGLDCLDDYYDVDLKKSPARSYAGVRGLFGSSFKSARSGCDRLGLRRV